MKIEKADRRDTKQRKVRHGMRVTGRSVFVCRQASLDRAVKLTDPK